MAATKLKHRKVSKGVYVSQTGLMQIIEQVDAPMARPKSSDFPNFNPGDTVKIHVRIKEGEKERIQIFEGTVIAQTKRGIHRSFTIRKISHGVGVERIFTYSSPKIAKIELVFSGRVRRAKLYYLRGLEGKAARVAKQVSFSKPLVKA